MRQRTRLRGTTIIEMLVCFSLLVVIFSITGTAGYQDYRRSVDLRRCTEDITLAVMAGENWRRDVRSAAAEPKIEAGVFHIPRQHGSLMYRFIDGQIQRKHEVDADWGTVLKNVQVSAMVKDGGKYADSWRWELELKSNSLDAAVRPLFTFKTVAGYAAKAGGRNVE